MPFSSTWSMSFLKHLKHNFYNVYNNSTWSIMFITCLSAITGVDQRPHPVHGILESSAGYTWLCRGENFSPFGLLCAVVLLWCCCNLFSRLSGRLGRVLQREEKALYAKGGTLLIACRLSCVWWTSCQCSIPLSIIITLGERLNKKCSPSPDCLQALICVMDVLRVFNAAVNNHNIQWVKDCRCQ